MWAGIIMGVRFPGSVHFYREHPINTQETKGTAGLTFFELLLYVLLGHVRVIIHAETQGFKLLAQATGIGVSAETFIEPKMTFKTLQRRQTPIN